MRFMGTQYDPGFGAMSMRGSVGRAAPVRVTVSSAPPGYHSNTAHQASIFTNVNYAGRAAQARGRGVRGLSGLGNMPAPLARDLQHAGWLAAVIPVKVPVRLSGLGNQTSALVGAGAGLVKTRNPITNYAAQGAAIGSTFGPIGAAIGAVVGAIGGAFIGAKRPESGLWDEYKKMAGQSRGIDFDTQFRNGAFVGLFRLGKNTFPPRAKGGYGPNDDDKFLDDMAAQIGAAVKSGQIGAADDANSIFAKVIGPWMAQWGEEPNADWRRWENQIVTDQIDAYIYDLPIVATSYTTSRKANPSITDVVKSLPQATPPPQDAPKPAPTATPPAGSVTASGLPAGVMIAGGQIGKTPQSAPEPWNNRPVYRGSDGKAYAYANPYYKEVGPQEFDPVALASPPANIQPIPSAPSPVPTLPVATPTPAPIPPVNAVATPTGPAVDVTALVQSLIGQGASNQQAFIAAMQSLQDRGVTPTPAVQQQVADQVTSTASGVPSWVMPAALVGGGAVLVILFMKRRRKAS